MNDGTPELLAYWLHKLDVAKKRGRGMLNAPHLLNNERLIAALEEKGMTHKPYLYAAQAINHAQNMVNQQKRGMK